MNTNKLYNDLGNCHPELSRGQVWCRHCGSSKKVDSSSAIRNGWPKCCGYTMTIDSPEEQEMFNEAKRLP